MPSKYIRKRHKKHLRPIPDIPMMTTSEAARALGVGVVTIQRRCQSGALPSYRLGRDNMIPVEAVEAAIEAAKNPPDVTAKAPLHVRFDEGERATVDRYARTVLDERGRPTPTSTWARRVLLKIARGGV
jgi:excisionase family DNA binding protein